MLKKMFPLLLGLSGLLTVGCGQGTTAAEIADSYGVLNRYGLQESIAQVVQSKQADQMIEQGQAKVRRRVQGSGDSRVLVTEYLIQGEPYRIEVRRAVDPTHGMGSDQIYYMETVQGPDEKIIAWFGAASLWNCLKNDSFEAQAVVALRAWQGTDGKIRGVRVFSGPEPSWDIDSNALNLTVRTKRWPIVTMWFRGLTSDARRSPKADLADSYTMTDSSPGHISQSKTALDGRWIMEAQGPSVQVPTMVNNQGHFINYKLDTLVK